MLEEEIQDQKLYHQIRSHNSKGFKNNYLLPFFASSFSDNDNFEKILESISTRLSLTNKEKNYCRFLNQYITKYHRLDIDEQLKRLLIEHDKELVIDFYLLTLINNSSSKELQNITKIKQNLDLIANFIKPNFPINGNDLTKLGYKGRKIGQMLDRAKELWIESNFKADKKIILKFLETLN